MHQAPRRFAPTNSPSGGSSVKSAELPTEILADSIVVISEGIKKLRAGRLTDSALVLLIQHNIPTKMKVNAHQIRAVLNSIESLSETYLKKKPK